jgi:hypothetical protein
MEKWDTHMLAKCPNNVTTFFRPSRILQEAINNPLLDLTTACTLGACNLDQRLIHTFNREWLRLSQCEALLLLGFECNITGIPDFVIQCFQRLAI